MTYLNLSESKLSHLIDSAINTLNQGGVIAYATESSYALGVRHDNDNGLNRIYQLKQRPKNKLFPLIIGKKETLTQFVETISDKQQELIDKYWPGPLTLLFKAQKELPKSLTNEDGMIAIRNPGDSFALKLAERANYLITATSANPAGLEPATVAKAVSDYFENKIDLIIDTGKSSGGPPSTLVEVKECQIRVLRQGKLFL